MIYKAIILTLLISSLAFADGFQLEQHLAPFEGKIIRNITIVIKNVFENHGDDELPFYFRWANRIHVKTRKSVIEGELLFRTGEPLDIQKVIETSRNIRLRKFIGEVTITASTNGEDGVDLKVVSVDNWTTKVAIFIEKGGGEYLVGSSIAEDNLLGYGRVLQLSGSLSDDNDGYTVYFGDDRIGRTRWAGSFLFSDYTLSRLLFMSLSKPQYSLEIPFGIRMSYSNIDGTRRLFSGGNEVFRYKRRVDDLNIRSVYSIGRAERLNIYGSFDYNDYDYSNYYAPTIYDSLLIPDDQIRSYPSIGIGGSVIRYGLERYLDEAGTPEDLTFGSSVSFMIGRSLPEFGADFTATRSNIKAGFLVHPFKNLIIGGGDGVEWWHYNGSSKEIVHKTELLIYLKTYSTHVLGIRALTDFAWRQQRGYQVLLGGTNGLRGYSSFELEGDRLALGNMEYRFYSPWEILTVRVGGVMFFDIGEVWSKGDRISFDKMKSDIGFGLRFGLTKSSTSRVLRFDIAKSLTENNYYVSFGTGMIFSLKSIVGYE